MSLIVATLASFNMARGVVDSLRCNDIYVSRVRKLGGGQAGRAGEVGAQVQAEGWRWGREAKKELAQSEGRKERARRESQVVIKFIARSRIDDSLRRFISALGPCLVAR